MAFEYNGVVYRDLEPQVRHDAEQIELLKQEVKKINVSNIKNGTGQDSLVQTYSNEVDATHYESSTTGESDVCLGEANTSSGKRNLITGKLNQNTGSNNLITGLQNNISSNHNVVGGQNNTNSSGNSNLIVGQNNKVNSPNNIVAGKENTVTINGQSNIVSGEQNLLGRVTNSIICGDNDNIELEQLIGGIKAGLDILNNSDIQGKALFGQYNKPKTNTLLEVGNGTGPSAGLRKNAFEVLKDGRVKVQTAPVDDDDVVRKGDLTGTGGGGKLYKHTVKLWHNHDNTYTDWLEYVEYRSNNTLITDRSIISGEYCYIHFTNASTGEEIMGLVNASIAYDNMIGLTGVAGSSQSSSAVNIYGLYEFENLSDTVTEL